MMSVLEVGAGDQWPPEGHTARIESYRLYRKLFMGRHDDVFERVQAWLDKTPDRTLVYIVANFPKLVSLVCADMLFGEEPGFRVVGRDQSAQDTLNHIVRANGLHVLNYEMALGASSRGDAVFKTRYGPRHAHSPVSEAIITSVDPSRFFPEFSPDDVRELTGAVIAWERKVGGSTYLRREVHVPGEIRNELWLTERGELKRRMLLSTLPECADLSDVEQTGYPGLLVEYMPNWRLDDDWRGVSDYVDIGSLVDELNNRLSRISRVLDKHESPKLILPPGMMKYDPTTKRYFIEKDSLDVVEVSADIAPNLPRYLVWDAHLDAAFKQVDTLVRMAFMVTEVSPDVLGMGVNGLAESGRALKFRVLRTLAKVNRKRLYFDAALKNVLGAAMWLESVHGDGGFGPQELAIDWRDGLPDDPLEETQIEATGVEAGITSQRAAVRRLHRLEGDALEDELAAIAADQMASAPPMVRNMVPFEPGGGSGGE